MSYAFGGADGLNAAEVAVQAATAAAWAAALWLGYTQLKALSEEEGGQQGRRGCATCSGTGHVTCFCTRWENDASNVGCGTCRGSRRMTCAACRGGGTAVPIEAKLYIRPEPRIRPEADYK